MLTAGNVLLTSGRLTYFNGQVTFAISPLTRGILLARKILLADDSVTAQNMGRKILADAGYEVITVNNGSAALKKIAELKPELIILDVYMPGYSGLEVCQRLKDAPETARIPVLLSVGKLEPFKPDEAKRVRAEGYIVKPFEASELLSALSKLEDKIVPKAEAGKPGRMSRAVAGADESSRSGDEPVAEGSWKNRISFPGKKKEAAQESPDDGDIYNAVNRDLKTVVQRDEPKTQSSPVTAANENQTKFEKIEEKRVDVGALATTGLPKDVTTEEIAALAAAAAHVHGRKLEAESVAKAAEQEIKAEEKITLPEPAQETIAAQTPPEIPAAQTTPAPLTPTEDEVSAAIARLEKEQEHGPAQIWNVNSDNGAEPSSREHEDLPVTMAASPIPANTEGARWTAVSVAVDPQEAALSLEREMQMAFRAFSTAAAAQAGPATSVDEPQSPAILPALPDNVPEPLAFVDSTMEVKTEPVATVPAEMPAEESRTAISEFAVAQGQEIADHSEPSDYSTPVPATASDAVAVAVTSPVVPSDQVNISIEAATTQEAKQEDAKQQEETQQEEQKQVVSHADQTTVATSSEVISGDLSGDLVSAQLTSSEPTSSEMTSSEMASGEVTAADVAYTHAADVQQSPVLAEVPASTGASAITEIALAVPPDAVAEQSVPQSNDSELAATTAAAWATWRQIRDSVPVPTNQNTNQNTTTEPTQEPAPAAALAVAAGAETSPCDNSASTQVMSAANSQKVASIVDSLLAELRPRIVEEISKKLAEKR